MTVAIYLCAFRMSDCCHATINRVIEGIGDPVERVHEFFVCQKCHRLCEAVKDPR